ncbi:hypothetical protein SERLA73DRAFT_120785 [Serpula lacrymans var. lacrymans S7.3]|uniref:Pre-rRNA-processing protein RIX1 n=1 Tax=Serpula lacrymans var. lacrymans (strain S7.3) TaxID=936435 RepID=F8PPZ0_SERL3|nr:hypothetical protein SERLA73DRAFT_120785 [Serpula lacrymans var. lacrymans S7.3]
MDPPHPLKSLLQLQLVSDPSTVLNISYVLTHLTQEYFIPSPHLQKWTTRITSMLHSKDPGARWAALCLAHKTSLLSKFTMVECSQTWLGVALPLLSKNEPLPILKASIRFLHHVFSATTDVPEFQRQVVTPNIPKFSLALISLAEKQHDLELKTLVLDTIASLVPLHPTSHRGVTSALNAMCLRLLNGSAPQPTDRMLLDAASNLYAVLHLTGGKVGAANVWRKSIDETLTFSWNALAVLRTTFPGQNFPVSQHGAPIDPLGSIPLNLDRLRCGVSVLRDLLRYVGILN